MNKESLLGVSSSDPSIISRYNNVVSNYNLPGNIVGNVSLRPMPTSTIYEWGLGTIGSRKGKLLYFVILLTPFVDIFLLALCLYCVIWYWKSLAIHGENSRRVSDPFKNMVFDPEICFNLKKDSYFITIEFKELQGFSLNYNKQLRQQLNLHEERGKANFMIYNANFWTGYHHFGKWKHKHLVLLGITTLMCAIVNTTVIFLIVVSVSPN